MSCKLCNGTQIICVDKENDIWQQCECIKQKQIETILAKLPDYTFKNWEHKELWHKKAQELCIKFINTDKPFLLLSGTIGSGKTHLCYATVRELIITKKLNKVECITFNELMNTCKNFTTDINLEDKINKYINCELLFIDDLFKFKPTEYELRIMFDIINSRYIKNRLTIFSSEKYIEELKYIDEAISSRIQEKAIVIPIVDKQNWRVK